MRSGARPGRPWAHRARGGCPFLSASFFVGISASPGTLFPIVLSSCSVTLVTFLKINIYFTEGSLLYRILLVFLKPQHESTIGIHVTSLLNLTPIPLRIL